MSKFIDVLAPHGTVYLRAEHISGFSRVGNKLEVYTLNGGTTTQYFSNAAAAETGRDEFMTELEEMLA